MTKAAEMAKVSAKGSFHLLWGLVISTVISSVGTIFIARMLGSDLYGLYGIVMSAPTLIAVARDWGVNSAMVRFTAQYRSENREAEIRSIFISGLIFEIALGLALSFISLILSGLIAANVFNRPEIAPLIQIASFLILVNGLVAAATAAFTGMEKMHLNSIMLIVQAIVKTLIVIVLVLFGFGVSGATIGITVATTVAGLIGVLLIWTMYKNLPKPTTQKLEIKAYTQTLLTYGIPLSIANIITSFQTYFYVFLLPIHYTIDNTIIGNYQIASTFVVLIGFFATPITTMLFPAFSKLEYPKDKETLNNVYQVSIKYASLLVVPVAALVMALAEPAVSTLFDATYETAPLFLALLAVTYLYTAFGNLSAGNLISSQGQTKVILKLTLLTAAIGFPMGSILILQYGVMGLLITTLISVLPSLFVSLHWIKKHYKLTVDWMASAKILLSSAIAAVLTYTIIAQLSYTSWIRLLLGVLVFVLTLMPAILFTRAITRSDINNLRGMLGGLGPLRRPINFFLNIIEKLMIILRLNQES